MKILLFHLCLAILFSILLSTTQGMAQDLRQAPDSIQTPASPCKTIIQQPSFPGGNAALMEYMYRNLHYPQNAIREKIQGRVVVSFFVGTNGEIEEIEVIKSPHKYLSKEAIRIVKKMPKWEPGLKNGKPVRVKYALPVTFKLPQHFF